mmetsp:Transcript_5058/g.7511  ORF Transcript_5058/g.7511 Transcript_5058/m.7511 type:complete len:1035 (+) Transcript_5058:165-3269(+)
MKIEMRDQPQKGGGGGKNGTKNQEQIRMKRPEIKRIKKIGNEEQVTTTTKKKKRRNSITGKLQPIGLEGTTTIKIEQKQKQQEDEMITKRGGRKKKGEMIPRSNSNKNIKRLQSLLINTQNNGGIGEPMQSPKGKKKKKKNNMHNKKKRKNSLKESTKNNENHQLKKLSIDTSNNNKKNGKSKTFTTTTIEREEEEETSKTPTVIHHHHHYYHHIIDGSITPPARGEELFGKTINLEEVYKQTEGKQEEENTNKRSSSSKLKKLKALTSKKTTKRKYAELKSPTKIEGGEFEQEQQIKKRKDDVPRRRRKKWRKKTDASTKALLHKRRPSVTDDIHSVDTFGEPDSVPYNFGFDEDEAGGDDEAEESEKEISDTVYTPSRTKELKEMDLSPMTENTTTSIETEDDLTALENHDNLLTNNRQYNEELVRLRLRSQSEAQLEIPKIKLTNVDKKMVQSSSVENLQKPMNDPFKEIKKTMVKENDMLASTIAAENHFLNVEKKTARVNRGHGRTRSNSIDIGGLCNVKFTKSIKKIRDSYGRKHLNQYTYIRTIGTGTSSKVKLCRNEMDQLFAIKIIRKKQSSGFGRSLSPRQKVFSGSSLFETGNDMVDREISILRQLKHPHIIRLQEVISSPNHSKLYLVLEYTTQGPLLNLNEETLQTQANTEIYQEDDQDTVSSTWDSLSQSNFDSEFNPSSIHSDVGNYSPSSTIRSSIELPPIPIELQSEEIVKMHLKQLLMAVDHIHSQGILHRDIKPDNILVDQYNRIKLSDFGVSQRFENENDVIRADLNNGTLFFQPPEAFLEGATLYGRAADIWAVGCTMYILLFNHILYYYSLMVEPTLATPQEPIFSQLNFFQKYMAFQKLFSDGSTEHIIQKNLAQDISLTRTLSPECRDLLMSLLRAEPSQRLTAKQALKHIWFQMRSPPLVKVTSSTSSHSLTRMHEDSSSSIFGRKKHFPSDPTLDDLDTDLESVVPSSPHTPSMDYVIIDKVEGSCKNKKPSLFSRVIKRFVCLFRRRRRRPRQQDSPEFTDIGMTTI